MARKDKKNQFSLGKLIVAIIVLALMDSEMAGILFVLALPVGIFWLVFRAISKQSKKSRRDMPRTRQPLDDCPKPICFHKDKGMHHVVRGKGQDPWDLPNREIDPWDRPDIDIRKYQRR